MDRIEKVSRYVPVVMPRNGSGEDNGSSARHMLLSIPRIKFLEGGETEHYHKYSVLEHEPVIINPSYSDKWCEAIKADPLTEQELRVEKLINDGNSHNTVAIKLHIAKNTIANIITRVRVKRAYQSLKK